MIREAATTSLAFAVFGETSRLQALLDHFSVVEDPRDPWRVARPLTEVLLLAVRGAMADCDAIAAWGKAHLSFLRRCLPYHNGVPGGRWLKLPMSRINPKLFSAPFTAWVREAWPERPDLIAIDGKTNALSAIPVLRRKMAGWNRDHLAERLGATSREPGFVALPHARRGRAT
jgi:hypothetical protein